MVSQNNLRVTITGANGFIAAPVVANVLATKTAAQFGVSSTLGIYLDSNQLAYGGYYPGRDIFVASGCTEQRAVKRDQSGQTKY